MPENQNLDSQTQGTQGTEGTQEGTTQNTGTVATSPSDGTTATQNNGSQGQSQTAPSQEGDIDYKTRWQASSEEGQRLNKENEKLKQDYDSLKGSTLSFVTRDRQTFVDYLNTRDLNEEEKQKYLNAYDSQHGSQQSIKQSPSQKQIDPLDPFRSQVIDDAASKLKAQVESRQQATHRFLEDNTNKSLSKETLSAIWPLALKLEVEDHLDPDTAIGRAKNIIVGQDKIEKEAYYRGLSDTLFGGASSAIAGGAGGSQSYERLAPEHENFIRAEIESEGLKGKAAEDFRKRYIERLASKQRI